MKQQNSSSGEWFLPDREIKSSGRLIINKHDQEIILEIYSTHYVDGIPVVDPTGHQDPRYNSVKYTNVFQHRHDIIWGESLGNCTLLECQWQGNEELGGELYLIKYKVKFVFWGAFISSSENCKLTSATFIFPYFSSWINRDMRNQLPLSIGVENLEIDERPTEEIVINENLSFTCVNLYPTSSKAIGFHLEAVFKMEIIFNFKTPVTFEEMLTTSNIFRQLLSFCFGKPLGRELSGIEVQKKHIEALQEDYSNKDTKSIHVINYSLRGEVMNESFVQHQPYMLLSGKNLEKLEMSSLIKAWFANNKFYSLYDLYNDSNNWFENSNTLLSHVMFNNRFLNLVQGLEGYYHKVLSSDKSVEVNSDGEKLQFDENRAKVFKLIGKSDSTLSKWLNNNLNFKVKKPLKPSTESKLRGILASFEDVLNPIFGYNCTVYSFPKFAAIVRDEFSHGEHDDTDQGKELMIFFQIGQILLAISVLKTLGVQRIDQKIAKYHEFAKYIAEIKRCGIDLRPK